MAIVTPTMLEVEEAAGLHWLFLLRGPIEAPTDIVVVSIDNESANELGLPLDPEDWPRSLHAEAVRKLRAAGAAVTAFDLYFLLARDAGDDQLFADSIREADNVILLERMQEESGGATDRANALEVERRYPPIPLLADAALGTAPFTLPRDATKVSRFWVFGRVDRDMLMLPAAVLHAHALDAHDEFLDLIDSVRPGAAAATPRRNELSPEQNLTSTGREIRRLFQNDPDLAADLRVHLDALRASQRPGEAQDRRGQLIDQLIGLYGGSGFRHFNFYGPARSIETLPYSRMLTMSPEEARTAFDGKIVIIGYSEPLSGLQDDDFQTPFSETGTYINGAEIGATAVANLRDDRFVHTIADPVQFLMLLLWGALLAGALLWLPARFGIAATVIAAPSYVLLATQLFRSTGLWLPVITPVFGQIPLALIAVFGWKYAHARQQGDRVRRTLETYLPKRAVAELSRRVEGVLPSAQLLHGICLVTDAQNYTSLAERLPPQELQKALNAYYAVMFPEVERRQGFIADVIGDSMVAIWATSEPDGAARLNACRAAIAIERSTSEFNAANPGFPLPTRIGIHTGEILLGNVGTDSHLEYRPIGDIVNTASRIQDFNKQLGTTLLVSEDVLENAGHVSYRRLGEFLLAGKGVPIRLCDRIDFSDRPDPEQVALNAAFDEARGLFIARRWTEAANAFEKLVAGHPADGPCAFYLGLSKRYAIQDPGTAWTGAVGS